MDPKDIPELPEDQGSEDNQAQVELETFQDVLELLQEDREEEEESAVKVRAILEDVKTLRKYKVPNYPMFIGREKKNSICIPEASISRKHAKVFEKDGGYYLQDLGSINGTYLNDKRIMDPVELKDGDRIKIAITKEHSQGTKQFAFKIEQAAQIAQSQKDEQMRSEVLKTTGSKSDKAGDRKKILLRNFIFKVAKQNFMAMLITTEASRRVSPIKIELTQKVVSFISLYTYAPKDALMLSIEHPRLGESLKVNLRVVTVAQLAPHGVYQHDTEVIKILDKHKQLYETTIKPSPLICYLTSKFKE